MRWYPYFDYRQKFTSEFICMENVDMYNVWFIIIKLWKVLMVLDVKWQLINSKIFWTQNPNSSLSTLPEHRLWLPLGPWKSLELLWRRWLLTTYFSCIFTSFRSLTLLQFLCLYFAALSSILGYSLEDLRFISTYMHIIWVLTVSFKIRARVINQISEIEKHLCSYPSWISKTKVIAKLIWCISNILSMHINCLHIYSMQSSDELRQTQLFIIYQRRFWMHLKFNHINMLRK